MKFEQIVSNNIDLLIENNIPFALYRLPQQEFATLVVQEDSNVIRLNKIEELNDRTGFVISPFHLDADNPLVCIRPDKIMDVSKLSAEQLNKWSKLSIVDNTTQSTNKSISKEEYLKTFDLFLDALQQNKFEKLVLSRSINYPKLVSFSAGSIFAKACELYPLAYVCLCHTPLTGTWFGCSPELLLSSKGSKSTTVSLAGTQKIENIANWDDKNSQEQEIVSNYMRKQLSDLGFDFIEKERINTYAGKLMHLKTEFEFVQKDNSQIGTLVSKLHPSPAVCGFPKDDTYNFITNNENTNRKYYSGFWGFIDPQGESNLYVNLRCMQIGGEELSLFAGGGLLPSSKAETEWKETEEKLQTMLMLLK